MGMMCPSCKMGAIGMGQGFWRCRICGMPYRIEPEEYEGSPFAHETNGGRPILQVYQDFNYGLSVVTTNDFGEYVYGRSYNPATGIWIGGDYRHTTEELGAFIEGRLLFDYIGWGHIGRGGSI